MKARRRETIGSVKAETVKVASSAQMIPVDGDCGRCELAVSDRGDGGVGISAKRHDDEDVWVDKVVDMSLGEQRNTNSAKHNQHTTQTQRASFVLVTIDFK